MARIYAVLDEEVDYGFEGGVRYKTEIADNPNRLEERDSKWKYGKHEFDASFGNIDDDERDFIIAVFHVCRGKLHSLQFKDHNDYKIINQVLQVGAEGTTEEIQLYKTYAPFGNPYVTVRPIQCLKSIEFVDENNDIVAGTWDMGAGTFVPANPWGVGPYRVRLAEFYVWVRFDDDYNPMTINSWRANTAKVRLVEDPIEFLHTNVPNSWDG